MSLAQILAAKRASLKPRIEDIKIEEIEEIEITIPRHVAYKDVDKNLFLAMYAPYIREPTKFNWFVYIEYYKLLFPDGAYVLNTFPLLNIDRLFSVYQDHLKVDNFHQLTKLCYFLNHIYLNIPQEFEEDIIKIIHSTEKKILTPKLQYAMV